MKDRLVNFIVCGAQKAGTSAFDSYLRDHPEICMARVKEVHFFDKEEFFSSKYVDYSKYHSFFSPKESHKIMGEVTPIYMFWNDAPRRIWEYNPAMKIIVVLRNPIDRAYSHWNMERARNYDDVSFWDAIRNESERSRSALPYQHVIYSYTSRGYYLNQLRRLWQYFPANQVLVLKYDLFRNQPEIALRDVCQFLDVSELSSVSFKDVHSVPYETKMSSKERSYLLSLFEYEIRDIERIFSWDCSDWLRE